MRGRAARRIVVVSCGAISINGDRALSGASVCFAGNAVCFRSVGSGDGKGDLNAADLTAKHDCGRAAFKLRGVLCEERDTAPVDRSTLDRGGDRRVVHGSCQCPSLRTKPQADVVWRLTWPLHTRDPDSV